MKKRYIIVRNTIEIGEADTYKEMYEIIGCTKQHFNHSLKIKLLNSEMVKFKNNHFNIIDRVN